jgi:hypothetical protein
MRRAVHHLRRRSIKRASGFAALVRPNPSPRLRSSMMAGARSTPARIKTFRALARFSACTPQIVA